MAKILVTMPESFLNQIDGLATIEKMSRSELIRDALKMYMKRVSNSQRKFASKNAEILEKLID